MLLEFGARKETAWKNVIDVKFTLAFHNLRLEKAQKRALDGRIGVEG